MWDLYNFGMFAAVPELALVDYFIGVALSLFTYMLPIWLAIMITQRS